MNQSYAIVDDSIAEVSMAETLREEELDADITIITDEGEPLYDRILTKEFVKDKLPEASISIRDELWYNDRDVDLRLDTLVTNIDPEGHTVTAHDGTKYDYDKPLLVADGMPTQLPVENSDAEGIHHSWMFRGAHDIKEHIEDADNSTVIGAGPLGIDLTVTTAAQEVEGEYLMRDRVRRRYAPSEEDVEITHEASRERNVEPVFDSGVGHLEIDDGDRVTTVVDSSDNRYDADFVGITIGLNFNTEILGGADIEYNNGIYMDEFMWTNHDDTFATGDITEFHDLILGSRAQSDVWGSVKGQGTTVAKNMVDYGSKEFHWVLSYSIIHFGFPFLSFGHPMLGDDHVEARYSDAGWQRLAIKDDKIVGDVLIGDLSPQTRYEGLMREQVDVSGQKEILVKQDLQLDDLEGATAEQ